MHLAGISRDHLPGKCIDPAATARRALCAILQDAETVRLVPMAAKMLATERMGAVDAAHRAVEHAGNMRRFAHTPVYQAGSLMRCTERLYARHRRSVFVMDVENRLRREAALADVIESFEDVRRRGVILHIPANEVARWSSKRRFFDHETGRVCTFRT